MLTQEKADKIAEILSANEEVGEKLAAMEPTDAIAAFKEQGVEVTAEDLHAFAELVQQKPAAGELDAESLENVSGGVWRPLLYICGPILWTFRW